MADNLFFVDPVDGSDSTGTGAWNAPVKTVTKAVGASHIMTLDGANPNRVVIMPGVLRDSATLGVSPTSGGPLQIVADSDGKYQAQAGSTSVKTGLVEWRAWTDDSTVIAGNCFNAGSKSYITIEGFKFIGGSPANGSIKFDSCTNLTIRNNNFLSSYTANAGQCLYVLPPADTALNLTVDSCQFKTLVSGTAGGSIYIGVPFSSVGEWSLASVIRNCSFRGSGNGIYVLHLFGTGTFLAGGLTIECCSFESPNYGVYAYVSQSGVTLTNPIAVYGCEFLGCILRADGTGHMVEDYNRFMASATNTNVAAGAHSVVGGCPAVNFGDERLYGAPLRPYGEPSAVSPILGGSAYGSTPTTDLMGRPRPEGGGSTSYSFGCMERHDTGVQDATYQDVGSTACCKLVGPSSQERPILVDASEVNLTVKVRWDGDHGDTNKPQAVLRAEPSLGVAGQTVVATSTGGTGSTPNAYETLTFAPFTPTGKGVVMLRLESRAAAGTGAAYFDSISL